jgi:hypothetical protein
MLLSGADGMLPLLAEMPAVNHTVDLIVTQVRMDCAYAFMYLWCCCGARGKDVQYRVSEDRVCGPASRAGPQDFGLEVAYLRIKLNAL